MAYRTSRQKLLHLSTLRVRMAVGNRCRSDRNRASPKSSYPMQLSAARQSLGGGIEIEDDSVAHSMPVGTTPAQPYLPSHDKALTIGRHIYSVLRRPWQMLALVASHSHVLARDLEALAPSNAELHSHRPGLTSASKSRLSIEKGRKRRKAREKEEEKSSHRATWPDSYQREELMVMTGRAPAEEATLLRNRCQLMLVSVRSIRYVCPPYAAGYFSSVSRHAPQTPTGLQCRKSAMLDDVPAT